MALILLAASNALKSLSPKNVRMSSDLIEHVKLSERQRVLEHLPIGSVVKKVLKFQFSAYLNTWFLRSIKDK